MKIKLAFCFLTFFGLTLLAQKDAHFNTGNEAYQSGDFPNAIKSYEKLIAAGQQSKALYYNLGNCYYKSNQLGRAILFYERALLLDSGDEDIQYNLTLARQQLEDDIDALPSFFLEDWWLSLRNMGSVNFWGILALLMFWAGLGGLSWWLIGKSRDEKKKGFLIGIGLLLFSFLPLALAISQYQYLNNSNEAILVNKSVSLKSGADDLSQEILTLHEGTKVRILDQIDTWYKVRIANGEEGWILIGSFEEI